jgi:hypothetical protein
MTSYSLNTAEVYWVLQNYHQELYYKVTSIVRVLIKSITFKETRPGITIVIEKDRYKTKEEIIIKDVNDVTKFNELSELTKVIIIIILKFKIKKPKTNEYIAQLLSITDTEHDLKNVLSMEEISMTDYECYLFSIKDKGNTSMLTNIIHWFITNTVFSYIENEESIIIVCKHKEDNNIKTSIQRNKTNGEIIIKRSSVESHDRTVQSHPETEFVLRSLLLFVLIQSGRFKELDEASKEKIITGHTYLIAFVANYEETIESCCSKNESIYQSYYQSIFKLTDSSRSSQSENARKKTRTNEQSASKGGKINKSRKINKSKKNKQNKKAEKRKAKKTNKLTCNNL